MRLSLPIVVTTSLLLSACHTTPAPGTIVELPKATDSNQVSFDLSSGTYKCEFGMEVGVTRKVGSGDELQLHWTGKHYVLQRDHSSSGLPRYKDDQSGLVWIDLPWKSVLLDGRTQKPIASECSHSAV